VVNAKNTNSIQETLTTQNYHEFDSGEWDTTSFFVGSDNYYCPIVNGGYNYYFAWYLPEINLVGTQIIKFNIKPINDKYTDTPSELVLKIGNRSTSSAQFTELYFPVRNKQTIQFKQKNKASLRFMEPGSQISTLIKINTPIEISQTISQANANNLSTNHFFRYVSDTVNYLVLKDSAVWSAFYVDEVNPTDILTSLAVGVDKNSCFKIEKISISPKVSGGRW